MKDLQLLSSPDYHESIGVLPKWRIGDSSGSGMNEIYPYYEADQCETILDDVCGVDGWGCESREVAGILFYSISIMTEKHGMIEKSDAGGARGSRKKNIDLVDKESFEGKTAATSAFVRAAARWGIGRHLSMLPKIQLKCESGVCITPQGQRLSTPKQLSDWCNSANPATAHLVAVYKLQESKFTANERAMQCLKELREFIEKGGAQ